MFKINKINNFLRSDNFINAMCSINGISNRLRKILQRNFRYCYKLNYFKKFTFNPRLLYIRLKIGL